MKEQKIKDFNFSKRADSYDDGIEGKASGRFYNLLFREVDIQVGMRVLDVGCGTGALLKRLTGKADFSGFGTDIDENMIMQAKKKCPQMDFSIASCDALPFSDQTFDVIIACLAYHHFRNKEGFAAEIARVIKPDGILYIADPRFPWLVRKALNGFLRLVRIVGAFYNPREIEARFEKYGFIKAGAVHHGYVQVVKLQKI